MYVPFCCCTVLYYAALYCDILCTILYHNRLRHNLFQADLIDLYFEILCVGGRVTYSGPSKGLQAYAAKVYAQAGMGQPPVANAPEVREWRRCGPHLPHHSLHFSQEIEKYSYFFFHFFSLFSFSPFLSRPPLIFFFSFSSMINLTIGFPRAVRRP
jgi:hypothetical protein